MSIQPCDAAVIWDLDGTLVRLDVTREQIDAMKAQLAARLRPLGLEGALSPLLPTLESLFREASQTLGSDELSALRDETYSFLDRWEAEAADRIDVVPHTAEILGRWSANAIPMALVTNNGPTVARRALDAVSDFVAARDLPAPSFVKVSTRGPAIRAKPDPAEFRHAFDALCAAASLPLTNLITIGDGTADWQAAAALAQQIDATVWTVVPRADGFGWAEPPTSGATPHEAPRDLLADLGLSVP